MPGFEMYVSDEQSDARDTQTSFTTYPTSTYLDVSGSSYFYL